jgi:DNA-nicking Smr family endonuclease
VPARVARGDRTLLVITGKGLKKTDDLQILDRGVLRAMLPVWLAEPALAPLIAGWDAAAQEHGGDGAFYVRLRRAAR